MQIKLLILMMLSVINLRGMNRFCSGNASTSKISFKPPEQFKRKLFVYNSTSRPAQIYSGFLETNHESDLTDGCLIAKQEGLLEISLWDSSSKSTIFLADSAKRNRVSRWFVFKDLIGKHEGDVVMVVFDDANHKLGLTLKVMPINTVKGVFDLKKAEELTNSQKYEKSRDKLKEKIIYRHWQPRKIAISSFHGNAGVSVQKPNILTTKLAKQSNTDQDKEKSKARLTESERAEREKILQMWCR